MNIFNQLYSSIALNGSFFEALILIGIGAFVFIRFKERRHVCIWYSIFFIVYITLLRRASGEQRIVRMNLEIIGDASTMAGNLLNVLLYIPFGWSMQKLKKRLRVTVISGCIFSLLCELLQFITKRGWADINDLIFNTLGAFCGGFIMIKLHKKYFI